MRQQFTQCCVSTRQLTPFNRDANQRRHHTLGYRLQTVQIGAAMKWISIRIEVIPRWRTRIAESLILRRVIPLVMLFKRHLPMADDGHGIDIPVLTGLNFIAQL